MAKIRVYQLAKELGLENAELIDKLKALNFDVKNHMSTLSEGEVERVRSEYTEKQEVKVDEIRIKPGIIRRRKKAAEQLPAEEAEAQEPAEAAAGPERGAEEAPAAPIPEAEAPVVEEPAGAEGPMAAQAKPGEGLQEGAAVSAEPGGPASATAVSDPRGPAAAQEARRARGAPRAVTEAREEPERERKPAEFPKKKELEPEDTADERVGRKKRPLPGKKVVEYKVKRKRDYTMDVEEDREGPRRRLDIRRDRRAPKRPALKPVLTVPKPIKRKIRMGESITVGELAKRLSVKAAEIIKKLMQNQIVANINQPIDYETASLIAHEYE